MAKYRSVVGQRKMFGVVTGRGNMFKVVLDFGSSIKESVKFETQH